MKKILSFLLVVVCLISSFSVVTSAKNEFVIKGFKASCLQDAIEIKWNENDYADKYIVYKKNADGEWLLLDDTSSNSCYDFDVVDGAVYDYKIEGINELNVEHSEFSYVSYCFLKNPEIVKVTNVIKGMKIKWNKNENVSKYTIMKRIGVDGKWKSIGNVKSNVLSFVDKNVANGVDYYYSLRKTFNGFKSAYSTEGVKKICVSTVSNLTVKNSPKGVTLKWKKPSNVKNFMIFRKVAGEKKWKKIVTVKGTKSTYIDKNAKFGKKNGYYVQVVNKSDLKSAYSSKVYLYAVNPKKPMIALTYDDGPAGASTNEILDTLEKYNARATFFVLGSRISSYSDSLKREASLGCEIACHTYNHITLTLSSDEKIKEEVSKTNKLIEKYTGQKVKLARAPGGSHNERVRNAVNLPMIGWSIDTRDWEHRSSSKSYDCVVRYASDGDIVLMHDIHSPTATASKSIIPYLVNKGYQLVTVSEMFDAKGIKLKNNGYYYCG